MNVPNVGRFIGRGSMPQSGRNVNQGIVTMGGVIIIPHRVEVPTCPHCGQEIRKKSGPATLRERVCIALALIYAVGSTVWWWEWGYKYLASEYDNSMMERVSCTVVGDLISAFVAMVGILFIGALCYIFGE